MRAIKDIYYVSADKDKNKKLNIKGHNGENLFIDIDFDKYRHAVQDGIIESTPTKIGKEYSNDIPLEKGDKVYFHHFVVQPDNSYIHDDKELFKCDYPSIYCVIRDGKINMIEDWILCKPIQEPEENFIRNGLYLKPSRENIPLRAIICHISKKAHESGLMVGDEIIFKEDSDYDMMIEGDIYYRMKISSVSAILRNGELYTTKGNVIVKSVEKQKVVSNIIIVNIQKEREQYGIVVSGTEGVNIGEEVLYFLQSGTEFEYNKETFTLLKKNSILGYISQ